MQLVSAFLAAVGFVGTIFGICHWYFSSQSKSTRWRTNSILFTIIASVVCITFLFEYLSPLLTNTGSDNQQHGTSSVAAKTTPTSPLSSSTGPVFTYPPTTTPSGSASTPTITSSPSLTPVTPGTVLYSADWSTGMSGWTGGTEWKAGQNMLLSDGSNCCGGPESIVLAPYQLGNVTDYKVQARIQFIRANTVCNGYSFGVMFRMDASENGYEGAVNLANGVCALNQAKATLRVNNYTELGHKPFIPGTGWHIYTVEVRGNQITSIIDGSQILIAIDNTHLTGGQVGIEDFNVQMNISSFQVIAL